MTDETEAKLVEAVKTALSTICRADKDGNFYSEIYADYRDEIGDHNMKKICDSDVPEETFWEMLDEWFCEATWDEEDSIIKQVLQEDVVAAIVTGLDEDEYEIRELIRDYFYVKYPEDHFLREDVLVDLVVDTGDANYDFVSNTIGGHYNNRDDKIPEESSLLWLARQQGYKKSELKKALNDCGICDSKFLKSIYIETANCSSHMNALVFLAKMELKDYFRLRHAINSEKDRNQCSVLQERTGRGYMVLSKDTVCGLYDSWSGAGSVLEITLEKDVRLPFRCLHSAYHDSCRRYCIREVYGCNSSLWHEDAVKELHPMKIAA